MYPMPPITPVPDLLTPAAGPDGILRLFVDGDWREAADGAVFTSIDPARGEPWATVAEAGPEDVDRAVAAARAALDGAWGRVGPADRARVLWRIAELVDANREALAQIESRDNGKAIRETRAEIANVVRCYEYFAGVCQAQRGATLPDTGPQFVYTRREPVGVIGAITPWNSPLVMLAWKLCPTLAGGNALVVKPAELTSISALAFAGLLQQVEQLPPGVVNVLPGKGRRAGTAIVEHAGVDKITFTGSTEVGQQIAAAASRTLKLVTFELGGKSPNVVFADANLEEAVNRSAFGIFSAAGQSCQAASRMLVQSSIKDEFVERLVAKAEAIRIGDPLDERTQMGSQVSAGQRETIEGYVALGREQVGEPLTGGRRPELDGDAAGGFFYTPTIFEVAESTPRVYREEIFGPVTCVVPFDDEADAIAIANDTIYGLSGSIWSRDGARALRVARAVETGVLSINSNSSVRVSTPFGGFKQSGYGRELGPHAMDAYSEPKTIYYRTEE
jgi:acyl-CoA reductase-like NAD-dependent aldehyde dehydrogenase